MKKTIASALIVMAAVLAGCDSQIASNLIEAAAVSTLLKSGSSPMDSDQDGQVSKDEWTSFHADRFVRFDSNSDGQLSTDELSAGDSRERPGMKPPLGAMDANGDGAISTDEWTTFHDALFTEIDEDGGGYLSQEELEAHRKNQRPAGGAPFALMDSDGSGSISRVEWITFHAAQFDRLDSGNDGSLSAAEQKAMMPGGPGPGPEQDQSGMDSDGDGSISEQEWSDFHGTLFTAMDVDSDDSLSRDELPAPR